LERISAAEQFPINPGELIELFQEALIGLHTTAALGDLRLLFEEEALHLALG
jgi:hypothetical protein